MIICFIVKQTQIYHLCGYVYPQILLLIWGEDMHHWLVLPVCFVCFVSKRGVNSNTFPTLFSIHLQKGPYSLYVMSFPLHIFSLKSSKNLLIFWNLPPPLFQILAGTSTILNVYEILIKSFKKLNRLLTGIQTDVHAKQDAKVWIG
jgi:hypothetical protein